MYTQVYDEGIVWLHRSGTWNLDKYAVQSGWHLQLSNKEIADALQMNDTIARHAAYIMRFDQQVSQA
jgi:hypothetical protein